MNNVKLKILNSYYWNVDMADFTDAAKHDNNTIFEEMVISAILLICFIVCIV
jgi:hypothetical protein